MSDMQKPRIRIISTTEPYTRLREILDAMCQGHVRFILTRQGQVRAIITGLEEFEDLIKTCSELDDPTCLSSIRRPRREYLQGDVGTVEEISTFLNKATSASGSNE